MTRAARPDRRKLLDEHEFFPLELAERHRGDLLEIRRKLHRRGYRETSVRAALRAERHGTLSSKWIEIADRYFLDARNPLHTLIRLFRMNRMQPASLVSEVFSPREVDRLLEMRLLLEPEPGRFLSPVTLYPVNGNLIATDWRFEADEAASRCPTRVMYVGADSAAAASLAATLRVGRALDLCTGSGVVALSMSAGCKRVTGVDVNPRAVNFARFNALLNGIDTCTFLEGDLYDPVGDGPYDAIVSNPPFVPTPRPGRVLFRDGGADGEETVSGVLRGCGRHLKPGGTCLVRAAIVEHRSTPYEEKVRRWTEGAPGFSCLILKNSSRTPHEYALAHNRDHPDETVLFEWIDHYEAEGIEEISEGFLLLRKTPGRQACRTLRIRAPRFGGLPRGGLEGLLDRACSLPGGGIETLRLRLACSLEAVRLVSDASILRAYHLAYPLARALESLAGEDIRLSRVTGRLREMGVDMDPRNRQLAGDLLEQLFVLGYLRPAAPEPQRPGGKT